VCQFFSKKCLFVDFSHIISRFFRLGLLVGERGGVAAGRSLGNDNVGWRYVATGSMCIECICTTVIAGAVAFLLQLGVAILFVCSNTEEPCVGGGLDRLRYHRDNQYKSGCKGLPPPPQPLKGPLGGGAQRGWCGSGYVFDRQLATAPPGSPCIRSILHCRLKPLYGPTFTCIRVRAHTYSDTCKTCMTNLVVQIFQ